MRTRIRKLREIEYSRKEENHITNNIIYMVAACAVFDYFLTFLLIFSLFAYTDVDLTPFKGEIKENGKIHISMSQGRIPSYIRNNETKIVRLVINSSKYSIGRVEDISLGFSVSHLRPGEKMTWQFFNEPYMLENWNYEKEISDNDQKYLLYIVTVLYEPQHETFDSKYKISNYKTSVIYPSN